MMLAVSNIEVFHGAVQALRGVSLTVGAGEIVGLMGRNGAGKTTTLRAIMGLLKVRAGSISVAGETTSTPRARHSARKCSWEVDGDETSPLRSAHVSCALTNALLFSREDVTRLPAHEIPKRGLAYVPQGRRLFNDMSVADNLRMGLALHDSGPAVLENVLQLLPVLRQRLSQRAGTLSGGEQQMLAMARALCTEPKLLLLDEPSEGLVPEIIDRLLDTLVALKQQGVGVLLVEQRVKSALKVCDRILLMENGAIMHEAKASDLAADPVPLERYIGVHR